MRLPQFSFFLKQTIYIILNETFRFFWVMLRKIVKGRSGNVRGAVKTAVVKPASLDAALSGRFLQCNVRLSFLDYLVENV